MKIKECITQVAKWCPLCKPEFFQNSTNMTVCSREQIAHPRKLKLSAVNNFKERLWEAFMSLQEPLL